MSTFCIQCALEAFVAGKSSHSIQLLCVFDETALQHLPRPWLAPVTTAGVAHSTCNWQSPNESLVPIEPLRGAHCM